MNVIKFPYSVSRRVHSRKPRREILQERDQ
jgi:hypothetical protein